MGKIVGLDQELQYVGTDDSDNPTDLKGNLNAYTTKETAILKRLALISAPFDDASFNSLLLLLALNTSLVEFDFTHSFLKPDSMNHLLQTLSKHPALEKINFSNCGLSEKNQTDLTLLVLNSPKLRQLNLSGCRVVLDEKFKSAVMKSKSLAKIEGMKISSEPDLDTKLKSNALIANIEREIKSWKNEETNFPVDPLRLLAQKTILTELLEQLKLLTSNYDTQYINQLVADFYLFQSQKYNELGEVLVAQEYLKRCISSPSKKPDTHFEASQSLGELYFLAATEKDTPPVQKVQLFSKAIKHLDNASKESVDEGKIDFAERLKYKSEIELGHLALNMANKDHVEKVKKKLSFD